MMTHISLGFCEADITPAAPNDALAPAYASLVGARILDAARRALAAMRPVRIAWGCAETNIGVNRRKAARWIAARAFSRPWTRKLAHPCWRFCG